MVTSTGEDCHDDDPHLIHELHGIVFLDDETHHAETLGYQQQ